jgi:serine/threonine protein kinase/formylglycine-generating enzyme required for sulfatase activity
MASEHFRRLEVLFHGALEHQGAEREAFLRRECGTDRALRAELDELLGADGRAETFLGPGQRLASAAALFEEQLPRRLGPYELLSVLGTGGMGVVYEARRADGAFEQRLAIKMLRPGPATAGLLRRFDRERRLLARLEHPGIARLVDAGDDEGGAPYLAMDFVAGEPIDRWCDQRSLDLRGRLLLLIEICQAVAYAHEHLVVHRDLKPQNVLVDDSGRPRLLDFGIALVLGDDGGEAAPELRLTATGERALTPAYAAPEQLRGGAVGPRADVYALGVLAHELLCGARPYRDEGTTRGELERAVLEREAVLPSATLRGPEAAERAARRGTDPRGLRRALRGDLDRIVATALRKEPQRRYPSAAALAEDLRRHLDGRPVLARGDGLSYRAAKFVGRHPLETVLGVGLLVLGSASGANFVEASLRDRTQLAEIQGLGDAQRLAELRGAEPEDWPAVPERLADLDRWLADADELLARREEHRARLAELEQVEPADTDRAARDWANWRRLRLAELVEGLEALAGPELTGATRAAIAERRVLAATLAARTLDTYREDWDAALARLAADPRFGSRALQPQVGLVPLGTDPDSGLEAFWPVDSGPRPAPDARGRCHPGTEGGLVLLLLPGGAARLGAQRDDPLAPHYDPAAVADPTAPDCEGPPHSVTLVPYLLSKYEVTQGQWSSWTGSNPSAYAAGQTWGGIALDLRHPVDSVSWIEARRVLGRLDLTLPTEAQWEHAARAGTTTVFPTGDEPQSLSGAVNIADEYARTHNGSPGWAYSEWLDDGHTVHAPVGHYAANAFGLHDVLGNQWEWCLDRAHPYTVAARSGDGLRGADQATAEDHDVIARGGSHGNPPSYLRSAARYPTRPALESRSTGLRPARAWR